MMASGGSVPRRTLCSATGKRTVNTLQPRSTSTTWTLHSRAFQRRDVKSRPPNQLHGVMVCRPKIVKFRTFRIRHLLAASACEMEMVARHQRHPGLVGKSIDLGRGTLATKFTNS